MTPNSLSIFKKYTIDNRIYETKRNVIHIEGERGLEMNATATKLSSAQKSAKNAMTDHLSNNTVPNESSNSHYINDIISNNT